MFHMKLFVGAKALVVHQGKVLLVRESSVYKDASEVGKWDVPGGRIEPEETLIEALKREVFEESGLQVTTGRILGAFDGFPTIRGEKCHVVRVYFECTPLNTDVVLSADHDEFDWVEPHDVGDKILVDDIAEMLAAVRCGQ